MQDLTGDARRFLRTFGVDYLDIRDPGDSVARRYGVTGVPETFFIAPSGRIVAHVIGVSDAAALQAGVAATATDRPLGARRAGPQRATRGPGATP
jgi:cytochrome c biogenesis protein CcmG/thiol:disulfide interchange protein DsbE